MIDPRPIAPVGQAPHQSRGEAAFDRGDAGAIAALSTEDATMLPPNSPAVKGKQAIEADYKRLFEMGVRNGSLDTVEVGSDGDLAYHVGTYSLDVPSKDGTSERDTGKFVDIYKRQADGSWKIHVSINNSDEPLPGQ